MDELINVISGSIPLPPHIREILAECFIIEEYPRHHILLGPGQVARKVYFISDGFAHVFKQEDGERQTSAFVGKGEFVTAFKSYIYQTPSKAGIELLANSRVLSISREKLEALCLEHVTIERLARHVTQGFAIWQSAQIRAYKSLNASQRLQALLQEYPEIFHLTTKKQIASYLGITSETLSRILPQFSDLTNIKPCDENKTEIYISPEVSMSTERLIRYLSQIKPLTPEHQSYLEKEATYQKYRKGQVISAPGEVASKEWFILQGAIKEYVYDDDGKQHVSNFWIEDELLMDVESFYKGLPAQKYLECLEDTTVLTLTRKQVEHIFSKFPESNVISNMFLISERNKAHGKYSFHNLPAEERYRRFCSLFPSMRFPLQDIASYLGMTPSTLSRVRARKPNRPSS